MICIHQINVDNYNNLVVEKLFSSNGIFDVPLDTNVSKFEHMQQWIKDFHFDHIKKIVARALVLITENMDMSNGAVNGEFTIITFIKFNESKIYQYNDRNYKHWISTYIKTM
jgi:hypothetical protein